MSVSCAKFRHAKGELEIYVPAKRGSKDFAHMQLHHGNSTFVPSLFLKPQGVSPWAERILVQGICTRLAEGHEAPGHGPTCFDCDKTFSTSRCQPFACHASAKKTQPQNCHSRQKQPSIVAPGMYAAVTSTLVYKGLNLLNYPEASARSAADCISTWTA